jgi:putative heme-binding domain-containing protein
MKLFPVTEGDAKETRVTISSAKLAILKESRTGLYLLLTALFPPALLLCQNPQAAPSTLIQDGKTVYASSCSGCHGADTLGTDHAPKLTGNPDVRRRTVDQLHNLIMSGIPSAGMPAFGSLPQHQLDAIAAYIHSLNSPASQNIVPGDAAMGGQFFWGEGNCGTCHMIHGRGSSTGPDLSDVGSRMTAIEIHTALLDPDQQITPGYQLVTATLRNGKTVHGFARGRTNFDLQLQEPDGTLHLLQAHDIVDVVDESHSLMKPVNAAPEQIQNLSAYLSQLTGIEPGPLKEANSGYVSQSQDIDFSRILKPRPGDWPTYNGKVDGNRYSNLTQINASNLLLTKTFLHRVNWATGIGPDGRPQLAVLPATASNREKSCPDNAANWSSTAFSETTRLYYLMTLEDCHEVKTPDEQKASPYPDKPGERYMRAINIDTGEVAWEIPQRGPVILKTWSGVLGTAGGVVFYGDPNGAFVAVDERKGKTLWHFDTNVGMKASPMTFSVDGKQFVAVAAGSAFLCFGLPSP